MVGQLIMHLLQVAQASGLSEITESDGTTKVKVYHWNVYQENSGNAAVYHILSTTANRDKSGKSKADDIQVQITIWHKNSFEAETIAKNIRNIIEGWQGEYNSITYYKTLFQNQVETFEPFTLIPGVVQTYTFSRAI